MALTRLGWDVLTSGSSSRLTSLSWITGKVRAGDAHTVLSELGRRFNAEVETIRKDWSWGYANRAVRGVATVTSEHAAGTAVDFNAPKHPLGKRGTFSGAQVRAIRKILADLDGAVRWGGDWTRADEMHFELQGGVAKLAKVAASIKGGTVKPVASKPAAKPKPAAKAWPNANLLVDGDFGKVTVRALQELLKGIDQYTGYIDGDFGKMTKTSAQKWLKQVGHYTGRIDGDFGSMSVKALQSFLVAKDELPGRAYIDGSFGNVTVKALQRYLTAQAKHYK